MSSYPSVAIYGLDVILVFFFNRSICRMEQCNSGHIGLVMGDEGDRPWTSDSVRVFVDFLLVFFSTVLLLSSLDPTVRRGKVGIVGKVFSWRTHLAHLINAEL